MKCPHCGLIVNDMVSACRGCDFDIKDLDEPVGEIPTRLGLINDFAGLLSEEARRQLQDRLEDLSNITGGEFVVVTCKTTHPIKPSEYVFWLFNRWQVGGPEHAGIMVLLAQQERRVESEVGYSWEPYISDVESGEVLDQFVVPLLRSGKISEALATGIERLAEYIPPGPMPTISDDDEE